MRHLSHSFTLKNKSFFVPVSILAGLQQRASWDREAQIWTSGDAAGHGQGWGEQGSISQPAVGDSKI